MRKSEDRKIEIERLYFGRHDDDVEAYPAAVVDVWVVDGSDEAKERGRHRITTFGKT